MRVAFVNPPGPRDLFRGSICTYLSKANYVWKPKDFILLSTRVPPHWDVQLLDGAISGWSKVELNARLVGYDPQLIVVALSSITYESDLTFLSEIRQQFSRAKIFVFGEVLLDPKLRKQVFAHCDGFIFDPLRFNFELSVLGRSQFQTIPVALSNRTTKKHVEKIHAYRPRHELFDHAGYRWPFVKRKRYAAVFTQYGCPFSCQYCTESITQVSYRPATEIIEELRQIELLGYRELHIGDATFGFPKQNAIKILKAMAREKFRFGWSSYVHPALVDNQTIDLMAATGCHTVVIGVESSDKKLLGKYGRSVSLEKLRSFVNHCHARGIAVCGDIMLGFLSDTEQSCLETVKESLDLNLDYLSVNVVSPLMGTAVREEFEKNNLIQSEHTGSDTSRKFIGTPNLSAAKLSALRSEAIRRFYGRPSYVWKRLSSIRGFEELSIQLEEGIALVRNWLKQNRGVANSS